MCVLTELAAFLPVAAVVICTPGPDTVITVRNTLAGGRLAGVATAAGIALGQCLWTAAAGFGLAGLLRASALAFLAVRLAGRGLPGVPRLPVAAISCPDTRRRE